MESFLAKIPKSLLALVVISVAAALIIYNNPPHSVCDVQMEALKTALQGPLYPRVQEGKKIPGAFLPAMESCRFGNSSGACNDYLNIVLKVSREARGLNSECYPRFAQDPNYKRLFDQFFVILAHGAWGSKAPEANEERFGWLSEADISTFCKVKDTYYQLYGKPEFEKLVEGVFQALPGSSTVEEVGAEGAAKNKPSGEEKKPKYEVSAKKAYDYFRALRVQDPRAEIWKRSLFSARCEFFR